MATLIDAPAGLEGVVVANTTIGDVRGDEGFFHYRGYPAPELAMTQSIEAVWYLLQRGHLPGARELAAFKEETAPLRQLPASVLAAIPSIAAGGSMMSALRTAVSLAGQPMRSWIDLSAEERAHDALRLTAMMPALVGAIWRVRNGDPIVDATPTLGVAEDYLTMIGGERPRPLAARALERYLLLTIDHGFNPSTFTARIVTSTGADLGAVGAAGVAALSGPLHGGAPGRVMDMLSQIGSVENARPWVERALASGHRIMGFGHRVYRTEDPRSRVLKATALEIGGPVVELAVEVERVAIEILEAKYPQRNLRTNVEFYAGVVLHQIGLSPELFSPSFAVSRMIGWMAHALEQIDGNRIIRPASRYVGELKTVGIC